jgi:hypothetical protein
MALTFQTEEKRIGGLKNYLRRTHTSGELVALADKLAAAVLNNETTITSTSADGGSAMGEITMPASATLTIVEELLLELGFFPATARQLSTRPDYFQNVEHDLMSPPSV